MADEHPEGLTCPLCLRADDPESMILVRLEQTLYQQPVELRLCRDCARTVFESWIAAQGFEVKTGSEVSADLEAREIEKERADALRRSEQEAAELSAERADKARAASAAKPENRGPKL